ncbi:MAG: Ig-like domain-containing protein [Pseudomonadota bacterium]
MNPIDFVVRDSAGALQRGVVSADTPTTTLQATAGQEISLNLRQADMRATQRVGDDLNIVLVDGRVIVIEGYFNDAGTPNRLFISADGYLNEVAFVETTNGELYAQFGPTEQWGKWSPSDDLIFLGQTDIAGVPIDDGEVSMLGAGLLGGAGLWGVGAAGVGAAVIGAAGGGSEDGPVYTPVDPTVTDAGSETAVGGDDPETHVLNVSGTGEPGDDVTVTVGDKTVSTQIDDEGLWDVVFEGDDFPVDGDYDSVVVVERDGELVETLDGPGFVIDTTPPVIEITDGTESAGDVVNGVDMESGVVISGTGEAGATVAVTVQDVTRTATVDEDGTWSVTYQSGVLPTGEYDETITVVAGDAFGNTTTLTDTLVVDTVTDVTIDTNTIEGDGVINMSEHADGVLLTGTAEAGASVVVSFGNASTTVTAAEDGTWSANFAAGTIPTGEYDATITAVATDLAGNTAEATGTVQVDTLVNTLDFTSTAGGADGIVSAAEAANGLVVTGNAEAGATVIVELGGQTVQAVVAADGSWTASFAPGQIAAGTYTATMTATATDAAGNTDSITQSVEVDTEADVTVNTASVEGDGVINMSERADGVTLTGTAQAGSSVLVTLGGVSTTVMAAADGTWAANFNASDIPTGEYDAAVTAVATDAAGNTAEAAGTVRVDTLVNQLDYTSTTGGADGIINQAEAANGLVVTGNAEPGSTVVVELNGVTTQAMVAADGSWTASFAADQIAAGTYTAAMVATATDAAGNTDSITQTVDVDTDAGTLTISPEPVEGDDIINYQESRDGVVLSGTADPGAIVDVTLGTVTHTVVANAAGVWQALYTAAEIPEGTYTADITATTTDAAGNTLTRTDSVNVDTSVDNLSVSADLIENDNIISEAERVDGVPITGTTEPGSTVRVTLGAATVEAIVDAAGNWTASFAPDQIPTGEYTTDVSVTATDAAGNVATVSDTVVVDTLVNTLNQSGPIAGDNTVNAAEAQDGISLGGQVEAGSVVTVGFAGQTYTADVDAAGNWSVDIPASDVPAGTYDAEIVVNATDAVGNTDTITDTVHVDTDAPDGPVVASFTRDGAGIRGISTEMNGDELSVAMVAADGTVTQVGAVQTDIPALGETNFAFTSNVPDGSHLVVTSTDGAGNTAGTYVVLDDESANSTVDLGNANLGNYAIEQVELQFAEEANLSINEAQLVALSDTSNMLTIHGGSDDTVTITGATRTGTQTAEGQTYDVYSVGNDGTLIIDEDINTVIG